MLTKMTGVGIICNDPSSDGRFPTVEVVEPTGAAAGMLQVYFVCELNFYTRWVGRRDIGIRW
jgi:hypothetical protein